MRREADRTSPSRGAGRVDSDNNLSVMSRARGAEQIGTVAIMGYYVSKQVVNLSQLQ